MYNTNIHKPSLVSYLEWTPILKWYVVWCGSKKNTKRNVFKETKLRAHNMITIAGSKVDIT